MIELKQLVKPITFESDSASYPPEYEVGEEVRVIYNPEKPKQCANPQSQRALVNARYYSCYDYYVYYFYKLSQKLFFRHFPYGDAVRGRRSSDEAIAHRIVRANYVGDCFAALAMTGGVFLR